MKTFCGRWTDRTTTGAEIVELYERKNGGWIGIVLFAFRPRAAHWNDTGLGAVAEVGELIAIPPDPVVRPWESRAEMFAVCGPTPWFTRKTKLVDMHHPVFSDATGIYFNGPGMIRWDELAASWLWYPHYGSDDGKPCVIEVQP